MSRSENLGQGSGRGSGMAALFSSLGATGLFFAFWLVIGVPLPWSAGAGVAGYAALWMLISGALRAGRQEARPFVTDFVDTELARKTIAAGRAAAKDLRDRIPELGRSNPLTRRCSRLAELLDAIASDVESDPKDAPAAHAFLSYQGEAASRLTRMAIELEKRGGSEAQIADSRARIERIFGLLESTLERQLSRLQEDNIAELQSELEVLEESLSDDSGFGAALLGKTPGHAAGQTALLEPVQTPAAAGKAVTGKAAAGQGIASKASRSDTVPKS